MGKQLSSGEFIAGRTLDQFLKKNPIPSSTTDKHTGNLVIQIEDKKVLELDLYYLQQDIKKCLLKADIIDTSREDINSQKNTLTKVLGEELFTTLAKNITQNKHAKISINLQFPHDKAKAGTYKVIKETIS